MARRIVCVFSTVKTHPLTFGLHEKLNQTKGKIVLQKVEVGVKNALDFQLSTYLGYLISENEGKNETYYIVSEDKGLAILTGYWAERGENVKTASDIAAAKEDPVKREKNLISRRNSMEKNSRRRKMYIRGRQQDCRYTQENRKQNHRIRRSRNRMWKTQRFR